jgi:large subunit ribosomal protein L35
LEVCAGALSLPSLKNSGVMPKMKSNSSAKKRFSLTGSGKVKRRKAYKRHILTKKSHDRKKELGKPAIVSTADIKRVEKMILV